MGWHPKMKRRARWAPRAHRCFLAVGAIFFIVQWLQIPFPTSAVYPRRHRQSSFTWCSVRPAVIDGTPVSDSNQTLELICSIYCHNNGNICWYSNFSNIKCPWMWGFIHCILNMLKFWYMCFHENPMILMNHDFDESSLILISSNIMKSSSMCEVFSFVPFTPQDLKILFYFFFLWHLEIYSFLLVQDSLTKVIYCNLHQLTKIYIFFNRNWLLWVV